VAGKIGINFQLPPYPTHLPSTGQGFEFFCGAAEILC
jgi:hypothetical protein